MALLEVTIDGETQGYEYEESIQGETVYDINTDEVGIISESNQKKFEQEVEWMDAFTPHMACFLKQEEDKDKEAERKYKSMAVLVVFKEFIDAYDDEEKSQDIIDNLDSKISDLIKGYKHDDTVYKNVIAKGVGINNKVVSELKWVKGQRMVRIRSQRMRNHNRWFNRQQVAQQIGREQRDANEGASKMAKSTEIKLLEKKFWSEDGALCKDLEDLNKKLKSEFFEGSDVIDSSIGAQVLRYSTEGAAGASFDWKDSKEIKVGAKATADFALAQAKGSFSIQLPDQHGFGLMQFMKKEAPEYVKDDYTEIFLKVKLTTTGSAFVGACASVSADLGLSCKEGEKEGGAQAGVELFAGAKAQAEAEFAIDTMFVDDAAMDKMRVKTQTVAERKDKIISSEEIAEEGLSKWESLGKVVIGFYGALGIGVEASFKLGYFEGKFRYQAKVGVTVKAGAGSFLKGELDAKLAGKLILTIAQGFNWQGISDKLDDKAQQLYHTLMNNCFYIGEKVETLYEEMLDDIDSLMETILDLRNLPEKGLAHLKIMDDNWDENIPGYSSYKQYNLAFYVLKRTYYSMKERNQNLSEKEAAIVLVQEAQKDKTRWNYATWQMKVNLIYDMRHDGSGLLGGLSEEDKEDAVIAVLKSCRHKEEFKKVVKGVEKANRADRVNVKLDDLVDFSQQDKLDYLRNVKFK